MKRVVGVLAAAGAGILVGLATVCFLAQLIALFDDHCFNLFELFFCHTLLRCMQE
jgi:hypothetical protein